MQGWMSTNNFNGPREATKHTAVIGTVVQMWEKLAWDIDVFEEIQRAYPKEKQPLAYSAINVCIAASSLADWVVMAKCPSRNKREWKLIRDQLALQVPGLPMCRAIANTSKHYEFDEGRWHGGQVALGWEEGDEDIPSGFVLYHDHGERMTMAFNSFQELKWAWWNTLVAEGLTEGRKPNPEWHQNKMQAIFGEVAKKLPPHTLHPLPQGFPHIERSDEQAATGEKTGTNQI